VCLHGLGGYLSSASAKVDESGRLKRTAVRHADSGRPTKGRARRFLATVESVGAGIESFDVPRQRA